MSNREIGPEASYDARWDCAALNIVNQIWQIPSDWPKTRRMAHAQILIIEALKAAEGLALPSTPQNTPAD